MPRSLRLAVNGRYCRRLSGEDTARERLPPLFGSFSENRAKPPRAQSRRRVVGIRRGAHETYTLYALYYMIIEIEYYKGDIRLSGAKRPRSELAAKFAEVERIYDKAEDNFAELFCRISGFEKLTENVADALPDYVYDRDTGALYAPKGEV